MRLVFLLLFLASSIFAQATPALGRLEHEIARLAPVSGGTVGATAIHIETGRRVSLNPDEGFPMASTFKIPVAVHLLNLVDEGKERLDRLVTIEPKDLHPGSGTLTDLFRRPGLAVSVGNLLELMLLISDNSATDVLLRNVGGPAAVTARLRSLDITGIRVDRPTALLIADFAGLELPPEDKWSPSVFKEAFSHLTPEIRVAATRRFYDDPRDTATPAGMADLLVRIQRRELLKPESASLLLDILRRCRTGGARLKGLLPADTEVAHKTGSLNGPPNVANDVGILTLPGEAGHVALAVFVKNSPKKTADMERGIAEIARAVHDFFLFVPAT